MRKFSFDYEKYNFDKKLLKIFNIPDLSRIHIDWPEAIEYDMLNDVKTDQNTVFHKYFYENINETGWEDIYPLFIKDIISPLINEDILYQRIPTFRVHLPSNLAVAEFHKDKDYSHSIYERNIYLPLTKAYGSNTIWVERNKGEKNFIPFEGEVGDFWLWDGANHFHGNKVNKTGKSRVSIDFRILPKTKYKLNNKKTITNNSEMIIGDYWEIL